MDTAELEAFLAVVRHGSFTRAARALHRSQPGVSRQVRRLEDEIGLTLLNRPRDGVVLTPAGEQFLRFAQDTLDRLDNLRAALREGDGELAGRLKIAASTTPGQFLVPTLVARYRQRFPTVQVEVAIMDSALVAEDVQRGGCDVGFIGIKWPDRRLHYRVIAEDEIVLAVPRAHRFAGRRSVPLQELSGEQFIDREEGSGTRACVLRALRAQWGEIPPYNVAMVLSTTEALVSAVEEGHGIGWVSSLALQRRDTTRVALVRLRDLRILRPLYVVHPRRAALSPVAATFVDWLRTNAPAPPPR